MGELDVVTDVIKRIFSSFDFLLVFAIVFLIQTIKKQFFAKINGKWWTLAMIAAGLGAAFLTTPQVAGHGKAYVYSALVYIVLCELVYRSWKKINAAVLGRLGAKKG